MTISYTETANILDKDASNRRIAEALYAIREKDFRSATIERLRVTWEAHNHVQGLPQQLQLGEGLYYLLDNIPTYISPDDLLLGRVNEEIPDDDGEALLKKAREEWKRGIPQWMPDGGHECFAWERLIELGLSGLEDFAFQELSRRIKAGETGNHLIFLKGAVRIYQAFRNYARRYSLAAKKAGLEWQGENCASISDNPPETFAEALQLIWLVGVVYCAMGSTNPTLTFGRLDELLLNLYLADLESGRLTRDEAGALIEDFYCKNNIILGRGEHQMSGGTERDTGWLRNLSYDAPQYVMLGGYMQDGSAPANDLTRLFLERVIPAFENPVMVFRYTKDLPDDIWRLISDKMRDNSSILVYNDEVVIPAMVHCGIDKHDALAYTMHGCNWPDIGGMQHSVGGCHIALPHFMRQAIMEGDEPKSVDEVYERFIALMRPTIEGSFDGFRKFRENWDNAAPGTLRIDDCFLDNPIAKARSWGLGGTKYTNILASIRFIGTTVDCIAALDELVFSSKKVTMGELRKALEDDFVGYEPLRQLCVNAPKFGRDDDRADRHAVRILSVITEEFDRLSQLDSPDPVIAFRCLTTDMGHIGEGSRLGATPDGRKAGSPVSDNTSPSHGSCTKGITAMFRSLSKLPFDRFNSGALNVRLQRRMVTGEEGLSCLAALLRTYFDMGGLQTQLSIADTNELRDAQANPESHRDLMVRITGYSAVFVDMCRRAQDEIIRRQEMEE